LAANGRVRKARVGTDVHVHATQKKKQHREVRRNSAASKRAGAPGKERTRRQTTAAIMLREAGKGKRHMLHEYRLVGGDHILDVDEGILTAGPL